MLRTVRKNTLPFSRFETLRHGEKKGEELTEGGVEQAREKARSLVKRINNLPLGTVVHLMPSNVSRAISTRNVIEEELKRLVTNRKRIEFISVRDKKRLEEIRNDHSKVFIITDIQPSRTLGFTDTTPSIPAFLSYKQRYRNDEDLIGMTWAARISELKNLRRQVQEKVPDIEPQKVNPYEFIETPEEAALKYLVLMRRMADITKKHLPSHSHLAIQIGHNLSADFAVMALMGKDISVKSIRQLGGRFRGYLEPAHFELRGKGAVAKIITNYRGKETKSPSSIDQVIERLRKRSEARKQEWAKQQQN